MPQPCLKPEIRVATNDTCGPTDSTEDTYLASLSPASLSTTLSSAAYYSTPQLDNTMDISDEELDSARDNVRIKSENSPGSHIEEFQDYPISPTLIYRGLAQKKKAGRPTKTKQTAKEPRKTRTNERSKTGCLTCRKRKKKCDETKPRCLNCTKTNYECEGYQPTRSWQPSASRLKKPTSSSEDMKKLLILPPQPRTYLFPAIENELDSLLLEHFTEKTSRILSIQEEPDDNPWIGLILPMAKENSCLMHSVLALSGAHLLNYDSQHSCTTRRLEHRTQAIEVLREQIRQVENTGQFLPKPIIAALIVNCLIPITEGTYREHKVHLTLLKDYVYSDSDDDFNRFAWEFYKQYEFSKTLTSLPEPGGRRPESHLEYFERRPSNPTSPTIAGLMLASRGVRVGVLNGEFLRLVSDITTLRDRVRTRHAGGQRPAVDPMSLSSAERLDRALWQWESGHEKGTARYVAAELFRNACLCYLSRTVRGARDLDGYAARVEYGVKCLGVLPADDPVQCTVLLPTFLLGCAAFRDDHRKEIEAALVRLQAYSHMGNIKPAREVLRRVWSMMDDGDEANWDWETVMSEMDCDILIT